MFCKYDHCFCTRECLTAFYTALNVKGANVEFQANETHLQWRYVGDAVWIDLCPLTEFGVLTPGPKGDTGEQGIQGEQGLKGDTGLQGIQGIKGDTGEQGLQGVKGDTGNQGLQGEQGLKGDTGDQGLKGDQGDQGIQGIQGLPGSDAQVTKANVEAVLTGVISTHSHAGGSGQLIVPIVSDNAVSTWTNMPLALTFWSGSYRHITKIDLTNYTQVRLIVNKQTTAGAAASKLILRYNAVFSTTVGNYLDIGSSEVSVAVNTTNTVLATSWISLATGAKADIFLSLIGSGGNGALDPAFGQIIAQFK